MERGAVIGSGALLRKMENLKFTKTVESDGYLSQVIDHLIGRPQRDILGS